MTIDVVRILLLDEDEKTYFLIHNLLNQIKTAQFQLQWIVSPDQDLAASQHYQVYLIDAQRLIKAEINSAEDLETLQQACRTLTAQVSPSPVIILTDNSQVGLVALQAGAADCLEKDLNLPLLERSLRLTLAHAQTQAQLRESEARYQSLLKAQPLQTPEKYLGKTEELPLLQTLTQAISEAPDFQSAIATTLRKVCEATDWNFAEAWIRDHNGSLTLSPAWYSSTPDLLPFRQLSEVLTLPLNQGIPGRVWASGQPEWTQDSVQSPDFVPRVQMAQEMGLKAALRVPIIANEKAIAVFVFFSQSRAEDKRLVELVVSVAKQLGLVLERKQAQETLKHQKELLQTIFDHIPVMITFYDDKGQLHSINQALEQTLGWNLSEMQNGDILAECYPDPEYRQQVLTYMKAATPGWRDFKTRVREGRIIDTAWANVCLSDGTCIGIGQDITERKQAEELLSKSRDFYLSLFDNFPVLIWRSGVDAQCDYFNKTWLNFTGRTLDQEIGNGWVEGVHPGDVERCLRTYQSAFEARQPFEMEYRLRHYDGEYHWILDFGQPFNDLNNNFAGYIGSCYDLTKRKQAEERLRQREQEFRALVEHSPDIIIRLDRQFRYCYINSRIEQKTGIPASAFLGKTHRELNFPEPLASLWEKAIQRVFETGQEQTIEYELLTPVGLTYWFSWAVPEFASDGSVETILVVNRDITKRKKAEEALRKSEERLRKLMDALPVCIAYTDTQKCYRFVNKTYEHWFSYKREEIYGKDLVEVIGEQAYQMVNKNVERVLAGKQVAYEAKVPYQKGGDRYIAETLVPDFDENVQVKGYYSLISDISEQKRAEAQLRYRLVLETALALVSKELATSDRADFNRVLQLIGVAAKASRAHLVQFHRSSIATMTHQWCDQQTQPTIDDFQGINLTQFPWGMKQFSSNQNVVIDTVATLPQAARAEKKYLRSLKINSVVAVPIHDRTGRLWGTIGFDTSGKTHKKWLEEDAQVLRIVGEMLYRQAERICSKEQLQASEALYAGIFNHSAEMIFLLDVLPNQEFAYLTINPAYEQATGIPLAKVAGQTLTKLLPPDMAAHTQERAQACLATGEPLTYEETVDMGQGKRTWRTILVPIRNATGQIVKLQGSSRDITEEKQAVAEQLRYSRHQQLLADLTVKIRQSWQIEAILSTAVTEIQKTLQADRVIFLKLLPDGSGQVIHEAVVSGFPTMLHKILTDEYLQQPCQTSGCDNYIQVWNDNAQVGLRPCCEDFLEDYQIRAQIIVPILNTGNIQPSIRGSLCVQQCSQPRQWATEDIELLRHLADQLSIALAQAELREQEIAQRQELARSNAELEQFAYIASHDLQQPLQIVIDYTQLLERRYRNQFDPRADKYMHHIVEGARRMQQQIKDLLEYSRLGTHKKPLQLTDVNQVLQQAIANLQSAIRQHQAIVTLNGTLPTLMADPAQLLQLFQNLIDNAIKYHSDLSPVVQISAMEQANDWLFTIKDNGIGIDPKYSERIVQIFQRLHTEDEYPGTGIGLAICQRIVQRHGGRIWVESQLGQGATFHFILSNHHSSS